MQYPPRNTSLSRNPARPPARLHHLPFLPKLQRARRHPIDAPVKCGGQLAIGGVLMSRQLIEHNALPLAQCPLHFVEGEERRCLDAGHTPPSSTIGVRFLGASNSSITRVIGLHGGQLTPRRCLQDQYACHHRDGMRQCDQATVRPFRKDINCSLNLRTVANMGRSQLDSE